MKYNILSVLNKNYYIAKYLCVILNELIILFDSYKNIIILLFTL